VGGTVGINQRLVLQIFAIHFKILMPTTKYKKGITK